MPAQSPKYTTILHEARIEAGLSLSEYCVADIISHLSNQIKFPWCVVSRDSMGEFLGLAGRSIIRIVNRLEEKGFVERNSEGHLRTTSSWTDLITFYRDGGVTKVQGDKKTGVTECQGGGDKSSPNNNIDNNNYVNKVISASHNNFESENQTEPRSSTLAVDSRSERGVKGAPEISADEAADRVVQKFNEVYGTGYKKIAANYRSNFDYWLTEYTVEEIEQAIENSRYDTFWAPKFKRGGNAIQLLFRKEKAKSGEGVVDRVDRIGQFLYMKTPTKIRPMGDQEFYDLLKRLRVPAHEVKERYDKLMKMVDEGTFRNDRDQETVAQALTAWVEKDLKNGYINYCNEIELIDLEQYEPKNLLGKRLLAKFDEYEAFSKEFKELRAEYENAPADEAEKIKAKLREMAPKGKQLKAEFLEMKAKADRIKKELEEKADV